MDLYFWLCCAFVCSVFMCYIVAYFLHGLPIECPSAARMDNKTVLITGGSAGIGRETALELAKRGARVIIASRQQGKGKLAVNSIIAETGNCHVSYQQVDLSDWQSIRDLTQRVLSSEKRLDVLINNAGIAGSDERRRTRYGYDRVFAVNYLGHFLLVNRLLPLLMASAPSRIISVTSIAHTFPRQALFDEALESGCGSRVSVCRHLAGYDASKLAMVLHVKELARRLGGTGVTANCLHPGAVHTDLWQQKVRKVPAHFRHLTTFAMRPLFMSARAGAQTSIYLAVAKELDVVTGKYFRRFRVSRESTYASDVHLAAQLWEVSMLLTGCLANGRLDHMTFIDSSQCDAEAAICITDDSDDDDDAAKASAVANDVEKKVDLPITCAMYRT